MEKIAQKNQPMRCGAIERGVEAAQVLGRRAARHRNSGGAEGGGFAEMWIGHIQRALPFPVDGTLGEQREALTRDVGDGVAHPAAFSSASCMRRTRSPNDSDDTRSRLRSTRSGNASGVGRFGCVSTTRDAESR